MGPQSEEHSADSRESLEAMTRGPASVTFLWRWSDEPNMPLRKVRKVAYKPE